MELSRNHFTKDDLCHVHYITEQQELGSYFRLCSEIFLFSQGRQPFKEMQRHQMITHLFCNGPLYHNPKFRVEFRVA